MKLRERITIMADLGQHLIEGSPLWQNARFKASEENPWFIPHFIDAAVNNITKEFLEPEKLSNWVTQYALEENISVVKKIGLVMAGNIPLVGFQDFLCVFISGHAQKIKMSSKDNILLKYMVEWLHEKYPETIPFIELSDMLKNCDAYIATGSDNSARYFEQYFAKYPHIIRRNRTSIAILDGSESIEDLGKLADDMQLFFGLGCRNVTQLFVPESYDFVPLLNALRKYAHFMDQHKYLHNFDYNLTIQIMNNRYYMSNDSVLLIENPSPFSPIGQIHYQYYQDKDKVTENLDLEKIQCVVGNGYLPFGKAQSPGLQDYADGVDLMEFLTSLK